MDDYTFTRLLRWTEKKNSSFVTLDHGSRVAEISGETAGSSFSYFLLDIVERMRLKIHVGIYEPGDFHVPGPAGCKVSP